MFPFGTFGISFAFVVRKKGKTESRMLSQEEKKESKEKTHKDGHLPFRAELPIFWECNKNRLCSKTCGDNNLDWKRIETLKDSTGMKKRYPTSKKIYKAKIRGRRRGQKTKRCPTSKKIYKAKIRGR